MVAPAAGAMGGSRLAQAQDGLFIGAQATIAGTGGAGVLQRSTASYDGAVVSSLAEGTLVTITEGPLYDASGQQWYGVFYATAGYIPAFTLASATAAAPADTVDETSATVSTPSTDLTLDPVDAAQSVGDLSSALAPGTAMIAGTNGAGARCRVAPDYTAETIETVIEGTVVVIAGPVEAIEWQPVICGVDRYGYIHTDFVTYALGEEPVDVVAPAVTATVAADIPAASDVTATVPVTVAMTETPIASDPAVTADGELQVDTLALEVGAEAYSTGYVTGTNGDGVRCRSGASYSAATITVLAEGSAVTIRGVAQGEWLPVQCAGQSGFAYAGFIKSSATTPTTPAPSSGTGTGTPSGPVSGTATVRGTNGGGLNCRATASYTGSVIAVLAEGASVNLRGAAQGEWQPVTCAGMGGYVNAAFIGTGGGGTSTPTPSASTAPVPSSNGGATTGTATVAGTNGQGLICRASASTTGGVLMVMPEGSTVTLTGAVTNGWQPVRCGSQTGFAYSAFLSSGGGTSSPTPSTAPTTAPSPAPSVGNGAGSLVGGNARVTSSLNLRYSASYSAGVAAVAPAGTVVVVRSGPENGFYRVDWDGLGGYMHQDYLVGTSEAATKRGGSAPAPSASPTPTTSAPPASGSGSSLVNYAMQYLGYPYVWAGEGPYGFDCSGFTLYVVKNVMGKNITHDMAIQISMGTPVSRGSLQPGDLIFFQNTFKFGLSHVGIYIGNGQFIHAENENTGVRISDLNSDYYSSRWYGAVRY